MASLSSIYVKYETLKTLTEVVRKKGEKGIELTISISDKTNQYGQNVSAYVAQTQKEREANKNMFYVGNGKNFWNNGKIKVADKHPQAQKDIEQSKEDEDDLPF